MLTTTSAAFAKNSVTCASECDGVETGQEEADLGLETKEARREGGRGDGGGRQRRWSREGERQRVFLFFYY